MLVLHSPTEIHNVGAETVRVLQTVIHLFTDFKSAPLSCSVPVEPGAYPTNTGCEAGKTGPDTQVYLMPPTPSIGFPNLNQPE